MTPGAYEKENSLCLIHSPSRRCLGAQGTPYLENSRSASPRASRLSFRLSLKITKNGLLTDNTSLGDVCVMVQYLCDTFGYRTSIQYCP